MTDTNFNMGNIVCDSSGNIVKINNIRKDTIICVCAGRPVSYKMNELLGLKITDEILIALGFSKKPLNETNLKEGYYYYMELHDSQECDLAFITGDMYGFLEVCLFPYTSQYRYQYVHQIQNIFKSIKGVDLPINSSELMNKTPKFDA